MRGTKRHGTGASKFDEAVHSLWLKQFVSRRCGIPSVQVMGCVVQPFGEHSLGDVVQPFGEDLEKLGQKLPTDKNNCVWIIFEIGSYDPIKDVENETGLLIAGSYDPDMDKKAHQAEAHSSHIQLFQDVVNVWAEKELPEKVLPEDGDKPEFGDFVHDFVSQFEGIFMAAGTLKSGMVHCGSCLNNREFLDNALHLAAIECGVRRNIPSVELYEYGPGDTRTIVEGAAIHVALARKYDFNDSGVQRLCTQKEASLARDLLIKKGFEANDIQGPWKE